MTENTNPRPTLWILGEGNGRPLWITDNAKAAKAEAMNQGMTEREAHKIYVDVVRKGMCQHFGVPASSK